MPSTAEVTLSRRTVAVLGGIVALGAALRFSTLGEQSFWFDEATTYGIVAHGFGHVLATVPKSESTPYLYYVLLWPWTRIFGLSEAGLRSFSALCGTLMIPALWAIGRRLVSERVGLIAALLGAVNPFLFWYAQEARAYSLLLLLSTLSLLVLLRALERPSDGRMLAWGLVSAIALSAHYFAAVIIAPEAAWLLIALRRRSIVTHGRLAEKVSIYGTFSAIPTFRRRVALAFIPPVAMAVALVPLMIHQNDGRASYIAQATGSLAYRLAQFPKEDIIGDGQPAKLLLGLIGGAIVLLGVLLMAQRGTREERRAALLPLSIGVIGFMLAVIVSATVTDYFNTRNMLPTWPAFALVVAIGLGAARAGPVGPLGAAGLAALSLFCVSNVIRDPALQRDDWRGAARALGPATASRALITEVNSQISLQPYLHRLTPYPAAGMRVAEVDLIWLHRASYGAPLVPVRPPGLAGFPIVRAMHSSSYLVVRYLATRPRLEPPDVLKQMFPMQPRALELLQRP